MKPEYERIRLIVTEFDMEDVIVTSGGLLPEDPTNPDGALDNVFSSAKDLTGFSSWW